MGASWVCPGLGRLGRVCAMGCPDACARGVAATSRGRDGGCPLPGGTHLRGVSDGVGLECSPASAWQLSQGARRTPLAGVGLPKQIGHARLRAHMLGEPRFPRRYPRCPTCVGSGPSATSQARRGGGGTLQRLMEVARWCRLIVVLDCRAPSCGVEHWAAKAWKSLKRSAVAGHLGSRAPLGTRGMHGEAAGVGHGLLDRLAHAALDRREARRG